jgi:hypothetical protein
VLGVPTKKERVSHRDKNETGSMRSRFAARVSTNSYNLFNRTTKVVVPVLSITGFAQNEQAGDCYPLRMSARSSRSWKACPPPSLTPFKRIAKT